MIDPNLLRNNLAEVAEKLKVKRNFMLDTEKLTALEDQRKTYKSLPKTYKRNVMLVPKPLVLLKCVVKISHHYWQKWMIWAIN